MKPSTSVRSGMPSGKAYIGWWGDMGGPAQKGIYTYMQSSYKQRPFAGAFKQYLFNAYARTAAQAPYFAIPFGVAYATYVWARKTAAYLETKEGHAASGGHAEH